MSLFGVLAIIAVLAAIPTYGLSFVGLYFAKKWLNSNDAKKITATAVNARSGDQTIAIPYVSAAGIRLFFNKYGSTAKKFEFFEQPSDTFIGYVKIHSNTEHVVMVNCSGATAYITSFMPPQQFGDDIVSLLAKRSFLKTIVENMKPET